MAKLDLLAVGDIILGPNCDCLFDYTRPLLKAADVTIGQLEVPHTERVDHAVALGRTPDNLQPLVEAGFDVLTLAGNHLADYGEMGIEDTIAWLAQHGIAHVGAGMNLAEARKPVILTRKETRIGFLNYNCVGPKETWAGRDQSGGAYINIITHYELDHANPGGPPLAYTYAEPITMGAMKEDILQLRQQCDIVVVSFHKGLVHTPAKLLEYEHQVSYAAIDAGADLVLAHHSHILKGVEWYRGKAIFHGLCNGFAYLPMTALTTGKLPQDWARRRKEMFGFEPDPDYSTYPFHPEAKYTMLAKVTMERDVITRVAFLPCFVNRRGQTEMVGNSEKGREMLAYMRNITAQAGLHTQYRWDGDEVEVIC